MASKKEMEAVIRLAGVVDPSLQKALQSANKEISRTFGRGNKSLDKMAHRPLVTGAGALTAQLRAMLREYEPDAGIIDVRPLHGPDGEVHFEADIDTAEGASG